MLKKQVFDMSHIKNLTACLKIITNKFFITNDEIK
jgi:hypothetical protein